MSERPFCITNHCITLQRLTSPPGTKRVAAKACDSRGAKNGIFENARVEADGTIAMRNLPSLSFIHLEKRGSTTFLNVSGLSWLLTFTERNDKVKAQCYLHADSYAPHGWYEKVGRTIKLSMPFRMPARKL